MTSETPPPFPALPVRRRETLEIFDTALKLYRRYLWVLLGWSALVSVLTFVPLLSLSTLFTMPFLYGAVSCCVAAAVRGQKVTFGQCWSFSKPRYGAMLGILLLSWLILFALIIAFYIAAALLFVAGAVVLSNAPVPVVTVASVIGVLALLVFFSALGVFVFGWVTMVPIVACLEDDKRGTAAMGRALTLLKGHWRRVFGMSLIIGLAATAVLAIVMGLGGVVSALRFNELFSNFSEDAFFGLMATFGALMGFFMLIWNPAQMLIIAVLYLDLRVRHEALDLEWTAYATAPAVPASEASALEPSAVAQLTVPDGITAPSSFSSMPTVEGIPATPPPVEVAPASFGAGSTGSESVNPTGFSPAAEVSPVETPAVPPASAPQALTSDEVTYPESSFAPEATASEAMTPVATPTPEASRAPEVTTPVAAIPAPMTSATSSFAASPLQTPALDLTAFETNTSFDTTATNTTPTDTKSSEPTKPEAERE